MRFYLFAMLLVFSFLTHATANTEMFQVRSAFSSIGISLNNRLAAKPIYDIGLKFINTTPILNLMWVNSDGDLEDTGLNINGAISKQDFIFRPCSSLGIATVCDKLSPEPSYYSPSGMRVTGPPQMILMNMCPSPGNTSCENHQIRTKPVVFFSTPDEGAVNSAFQVSHTKYAPRNPTTGLTAPVTITTSINGEFAFILEGKGTTGRQRILKCGIERNTAQLTFCTSTAADLNAFSDVTDIALRPINDFLFVVADGDLFRLRLDADNNIGGSPVPITNVGQPITDISSITQSPTSDVFMVVSKANAAFSVCHSNVLSGAIACRNLTNIGPAVTAPGKPIIISNNNGAPHMLVPDETAIKDCVLDQKQGAFSCGLSVEFGAVVNAVTHPISIIGYTADFVPLVSGRELTFVVALDDLGVDPALGTLQSCTFRSVDQSTTCQPAMPTALTTKAQAATLL